MVFITYPNETFEQIPDRFLNVKSNITYSPSGFDYLSASFNRRVSQFSLEKLIPGTELTSFQSVVIPGQSFLSPRHEMTLELSGAKKIQDINLLFDPAILYGQVYNADRFLFEESPVISIAFDQLRAEYLLISAPIIKNFKQYLLILSLNLSGLSTKTRMWMTRETTTIPGQQEHY